MPSKTLDWAAAHDARRPLLEKLADILESKTRDELSDVPHVDRISFRAKERASFVEKCSRREPRESGPPKYQNPLVEIEDQVAGRVLTFFQDDIDQVCLRLEALFGPVEHRYHEPAGVSEFGYESDHYVFVIAEHHKPTGWSAVPEMPTTFEMQIRTLFMHAWAEPQHDLGFKGKPSRDIERELAWIAASAWGADRALNAIATQLRP